MNASIHLGVDQFKFILNSELWVYCNEIQQRTWLMSLLIRIIVNNENNHLLLATAPRFFGAFVLPRSLAVPREFQPLLHEVPQSIRLQWLADQSWASIVARIWPTGFLSGHVRGYSGPFEMVDFLSLQEMLDCTSLVAGSVAVLEHKIILEYCPSKRQQSFLQNCEFPAC
jgi:hypothetical protein